MKYRVKRNQCQDIFTNPNSTAGQVRKRTGLNEIQQADRVKRDTNQSTCPHYPPNSQDSHAVSIRYKVIPSDKRARTTPKNQSAQQARYASEKRLYELQARISNHPTKRTKASETDHFTQH